MAKKADSKLDGRSLPDVTMDYIRKIAVQAVEEKGHSPEVVINVLGLSRSCIYTWLRRYRAEGESGLQTRQAPGREAVLTAEMDAWLREVILQTTPVDHGYDSVLWTRERLAELLKREFGVEVSGRTVSAHLSKMGLSYRKPNYRSPAQDPAEVAYFLDVKHPAIQRQAEKLGADIAFEDESGVHLQTHAGKTWGERGHAPIVVRTHARGGYNVLSTVEPSGRLRYQIESGRINSQRYMAFLQHLLKGRTRPLILLVDRVAFHVSKKVRDFVRARRHRLRVFFLPRYAPEYNPDEHVWEEIKDKKIGRQPVKNKADLKKRLHSALKSLQRRTARVISFFQLPTTQYAMN